MRPLPGGRRHERRFSMRSTPRVRSFRARRRGTSSRWRWRKSPKRWCAANASSFDPSVSFRSAPNVSGSAAIHAPASKRRSNRAACSPSNPRPCCPPASMASPRTKHHPLTEVPRRRRGSGTRPERNAAARPCRGGAPRIDPCAKSAAAERTAQARLAPARALPKPLQTFKMRSAARTCSAQGMRGDRAGRRCISILEPSRRTAKRKLC